MLTCATQYGVDARRLNVGSWGRLVAQRCGLKQHTSLCARGTSLVAATSPSRTLLSSGAIVGALELGLNSVVLPGKPGDARASAAVLSKWKSVRRAPVALFVAAAANQGVSAYGRALHSA